MVCETCLCHVWCVTLETTTFHIYFCCRDLKDVCVWGGTLKPESLQWTSLMCCITSSFLVIHHLKHAISCFVSVLSLLYYYESTEFHRTYLGPELVAYTCVLKHTEGRGRTFLCIYEVQTSLGNIQLIIAFLPNAIKKHSQKI